MVANRTINRARRRELLRHIIDNLITAYSCNDTELESIPIIKLNSINIDSCDFLKWLRREQREGSGTHIYTNRLDSTAES
jgi:hypothetical protein